MTPGPSSLSLSVCSFIQQNLFSSHVKRRTQPTSMASPTPPGGVSYGAGWITWVCSRVHTGWRASGGAFYIGGSPGGAGFTGRWGFWGKEYLVLLFTFPPWAERKQSLAEVGHANVKGAAKSSWASDQLRFCSRWKRKPGLGCGVGLKLCGNDSGYVTDASKYLGLWTLTTGYNCHI